MNVTLPTDAAARKDIPLVAGCLDYFPAALSAVAAAALAGEGALLAEPEAVGLLDGLGVRTADVALEGRPLMAHDHLHIRELGLHEVPDALEGLGRIHGRNQAAAQF